MTSNRTRDLVLLLIALLWALMVVHSLDYLGRFMFHTLLISVRWLQLLFIALGLYGGTLLLLSVRQRPASPLQRTARPFVSVLIPARDEERVIEGTLRNLAALDYHAAGRRRFELIVIDDGSTDDSARILRRLARDLPLRVVRPAVSGRGKGAALNVGARHARGDLLAVFDADARVAPDFLQRLVAALDGPGLAGVQGRRLFYNGARNILTRMQEDEFTVMFTAFQRTRQAVGAFVNFAGNGLIITRAALDAVGGWNDEALTEDIDLSVRLYLAGWRIRYCDDAPVWEEAVVTLPALVRQRTRWFEGALRCLGEQLPAMLFGRGALRVRLDMLFFLAGLLLATLALLTTYVYAVIGLAGVVILFLGIPPQVMAVISIFFTVSMVAAVADERGRRPLVIAGVVLRAAVFSLHRAIIVPLAFIRYIRAAVTGRVDWAKTTHRGEMTAEGAGEGGV